MTFEFHPDAEQEFIEEAAYYESEVPGWDPGLRMRWIVSLSCFAKIQRAERLWTSTSVILL
jgi:hypothetical protein